MIKPNFFIVGAPKCGTTAMNDYLIRHPDIFMATKEIHYFGSDLKTRVKISEAEYLKHFQKAGNRKVVGEASVWYLFSTRAANEIKSFSPDAKILIMLRNPVQVVHSLHSQHLYDGNESVTGFEAALNLDEDRKKGNKLSDSIDFFELPTYIASVLFADQVKRYLDVFGKTNVHIILYEDFKANTEQTVAEMLNFLGVDNKPQIEYGVINPNKSILFFSLHRLLRKPSPGLKKVVRIIIPVKKIRHAIMFYLFSWNISVQKRGKMDDDLYNRLKETLKDDIQVLSEIINRDLSGWIK